MTATWTSIHAPATFSGVSSHTVTAVNPGVVLVCGGEDGPRSLVPPAKSLWRFSNYELEQVSQQEGTAVSLLGHTAFGINDELYVCKFFGMLVSRS